MTEKGLYHAALFAIQPNMLGFCGENRSQEILRRFITKNIDSAPVADTLRNHGFPDLNSFLDTISQITKREVFDEKVVSSYWYGNDLTTDTYDTGKDLLIAQYSKYVSPQFAETLRQKLPSKFYLTHLSQVALIAASDYDTQQRTQLINLCMIASGTVVDFNPKNKIAIVKRDILVSDTDGKYIVKTGQQDVKIDPDLVPNILNINDDVAIHLGYLAAKLNLDENKKLKYWTRKVAQSIYTGQT